MIWSPIVLEKTHVKLCISCSQRRPTYGCQQQNASASSPACQVLPSRFITQIRESRSVVFLFPIQLLKSFVSSNHPNMQELQRLNQMKEAWNYDRVKTLRVGFQKKKKKRVGFHRSPYSLCFFSLLITIFTSSALFRHGEMRCVSFFRVFIRESVLTVAHEAADIR